MGYYDFPHTRNYDTDLGYLIKQYFRLRDEVELLISSQTITYADPLQWNITTQYKTNTIVINGYNAYLSKQAVPKGILITNTDYWLVVGDFIQEFEDLRNNIADANNGVSPTLLVDRKQGDLLWWNDILYQCLTDIVSGTALIVGTNIKQITIEKYVDTSLQIEINNRQATDNEITNNLNAEINNRQAADTEITNNLNAEIEARINGDKTTLASAKTYADSKTGINFFANKKVVIFGDSLSATMDSYWGRVLELIPSMTIENKAVAGTSMADCVSLINKTTLSNYDIVVIAFGTNNWQANETLQNFIIDTSSVYNAIISQNANVEVMFIAPPFGYNAKNLSGETNSLSLKTRDYADSITKFCVDKSIPCINLSNVSNININTYTKYLQADTDPQIYLHPNTIGREFIAQVVANCFISNGVNYTYGVHNLDTGAIVYIITPETITLQTFNDPTAGALTNHVLPKELCPIYPIVIPAIVSYSTHGVVSISTGGQIVVSGHNSASDSFNFCVTFIRSNVYD